MCFQVPATEKACVLQAFFLSGLFLTGKFFAEQFIDLCRIGFAASRFHDLTDKRIECFFLAGPEFLDGAGIVRQYLVNDFLDGTGVGNLFQSLGV